MKKLLVLLLCLLAVFAIVSCKQEPEKGGEPTPAPADDSTVFVLTATAAGDRFQFKWDSVEESGGEVFTLKYKTDKVVTQVTTRDPSGAKYLDCASIGTYISEADAEGWITFTCTIPEGTHTGFGIAFFAADIAATDVFRVKDIMIGEEEMVLAQENSWGGCNPTITVEGKVED